MAIKLGTQTPGIMLVTAPGDLSSIPLLDTSPINPISRQWSISYYPDELASAPAVSSATSNPASFTPPVAGRWYVVRLVRTLLLGDTVIEAAICIPDATGTYAIPAPGMPADIDPTKTIINLNDDAKAVGFAGSVKAGVPGEAAALRMALALASAGGSPATDTVSGTQSAHQFSRVAGLPVNARETGALGNDSHDDVSAIASAFAIGGDVYYSAGTFKLNTSETIGNSLRRHIFASGAKLHVPAGIDIELLGTIEAPPGEQIFQVDSTGSLTLTDVSSVHVGWFGATGESDAHDDMPGIVAASQCFSAVGGGTVHFHKATFRVRSAGQLGRFALDGGGNPVSLLQSQGVKWVFDRANITPSSAGPYADFKVAANLGCSPMLSIRGGLRYDLGNPNIDCNGLCAIGLQVAAPLLTSPAPSQGGVTGWQCRFSGTVRNAKTIRVLSGELMVEASVTGSTFSVLANGPGHGFLVGHKLYFARPLDSIHHPSDFDIKQLYRVVARTQYTFQICLDSDGTNTPISATTDQGFGRWLIGIADAGDCSQFLWDNGQATNDTIAGCVALFSFYQHGMNTLGTTFFNTWFQGGMANAGTAVAITFNGGAHTFASTLQVYDGQAFRSLQTGDAIMVYGAIGGGNAPPAALAADTEYWVVNGNQLATKPGGTPIAFGAATGTVNVACLNSPYNHIGHVGGSLRLYACSSVGARARVRVMMRPNGTNAAFLGAQLEDSGDCQDWAWLLADCSEFIGASATPQNGAMRSTVQHQNIWLGAVVDAVRWGYPVFSSLNLSGASFGGDIKILDGASHVHLDCDLETDGAAWVPLVVGHDNTEATLPLKVSGRYVSNGVPYRDFGLGKYFDVTDGTHFALRLNGDSPRIRAASGSGLSLESFVGGDGVGVNGWIQLTCAGECKVTATQFTLRPSTAIALTLGSAASGTGVDRLFEGEGGGAGNNAGGAVVWAGGPGTGTGNIGAFRVWTSNAPHLGFQAGSVGSGRRFVALNFENAALDATALPSGSAVVVLGPAAAVPTTGSPPVGCMPLWWDSDFALRAMVPAKMRSALTPSYESSDSSVLVDVGDLKEQVGSTTNATAATVVGSTGVIPDSSSARIRVDLTVINPSTRDSAVWSLFARVKRVSGTLTIGSVDGSGVPFEGDTALALTNATLAANDTAKKIEIQVTGIAATALRWHASISVATVTV
jgi:hypothetical protein